MRKIPESSSTVPGIPLSRPAHPNSKVPWKGAGLSSWAAHSTTQRSHAQLTAGRAGLCQGRPRPTRQALGRPLPLPPCAGVLGLSAQLPSP